MAGFKFSINVEPQDIPRLDDAHKRDCADALTASVNRTLKYTLIMSGAVMALFAAYSFFGFIWMLRMHSMLPRVSAIVPLAAVVIFLFEFISGTMKGWALALQTFFHVVLIFAAVTSAPSIIAVPFAIYGAVLHFKLITLLPWYKAISVQPGYPEFTSLPEKSQISLVKKADDTQRTEDEKESAVTETKPEEKQSDITENKPEEKQSDVTETKPEEKQSDITENKPEEKQSAVTETKPEGKQSDVTESKPEEKQSDDIENKPEETKPAVPEKQQTANKPSGGSGKKKHKRRKGKK